jgi:hypothetical protein
MEQHVVTRVIISPIIPRISLDKPVWKMSAGKTKT